MAGDGHVGTEMHTKLKETGVLSIPPFISPYHPGEETLAVRPRGITIATNWFLPGSGSSSSSWAVLNCVNRVFLFPIASWCFLFSSGFNLLFLFSQWLRCLTQTAPNSQTASLRLSPRCLHSTALCAKQLVYRACRKLFSADPKCQPWKFMSWATF